MANDLAAAEVRNPDVKTEHLSARRALATLAEARRHEITAGERKVELFTRRNPLQKWVLAAPGADTSSWEKKTIT